MKLLVFSDLHLELHPEWSLEGLDWPEYDVAVCAGDISQSIALSVAELATHPILGRKPVIYVPGNHEYWNEQIDQAEQAGHWAALGTNVHLLQANSVKIKDVTFIGATLWTDYALRGYPATDATEAARGMTDHARITIDTGRGTRAFMPGDAMDRHEAHRDYVDGALAAAPAKAVVVTHHLPHERSIDPSHAGDGDACYASNLEDLILSRQPTAWIHGHTHRTCDYWIGKTRIACMPKGYGPKGTKAIENPTFKHDWVIQI